MSPRRFLMAALVCTVLGCGSSITPEDVYGVVAPFQLSRHDGGILSRDELLGKVWIASFVYSRCCTGCPKITATLTYLQNELADMKDVVLVSFSVDPEHDTPEALRAFAESKGAKKDRWVFLTGDKEAIYDLSRHSFMQAVHENVGEARRPGDEVTHSSKLSLVDRRGRIRGFYDGQSVADVPKLKDKIASLLRER